MIQVNRVFGAALAAALVLGAASVAHAAGVADTVFLANGGRLRGTVTEEDPKTGVKILLADGTVKVIPAAEVKQVVYGESSGATTAPATPAPAPGAAAFYGPDGAPPPYGARPSGERERSGETGETQGIKGLYIAGPIVLGVTWVTTIAVTAAVSSDRDRGEATGLAAIPVAGPWAMLGDDNLKTKDYVGALVASGVLQGSGLVMTVLGLAIRRPVRRYADAPGVVPYAAGTSFGLAGRF